jgi:hypothetical protein
MIFGSRLYLWLAGLAVIVITNAAIFAVVAFNRSTREAVLELNERELVLPYDWQEHTEDSVISLRLETQLPRPIPDLRYDPEVETQSPWLDGAKLRELGFEVDTALATARATERGSISTQEVFLVLEHNGPAYQAQVKATTRRLEQARAVAAGDAQDEHARNQVEGLERVLFREQYESSRLFVIDAGLDAERLRLNYPERNMHAIISGYISMTMLRTMLRDQSDDWRAAAYVNGLAIRQVNIPSRFTKIFSRQETEGNYNVTLAWGARLEPWVLSVEARELK